MLDIYNRFRDFHVFKKFKYLLGDWWNIDILIVVKKEKKFFYDNVSPFNNPIVKSLFAASVFRNYFFSSLSAAINKKSLSGGLPKMLPWKQTGLNLLLVPLVVKNAPMEAFLVATGFAPRKEDRLRQSLLYLGLSRKAIEQKLNDLKKLSGTDEVYIQRMLRILAEEFLTLIQERKKRDHLIEQLNYKGSHSSYGPMLGRSPVMSYIFNVLEKIRYYSASVLIEGENGTGKKLLARTIHAESERAKKPFYLQNFSAFTGKLLEREIFGWSPGLFSKPTKPKKVLLEKIEGGTLFLNEIGNTSLEFQSKLLHFLKEGVFFPEGALQSKPANVRIISSTSKDLKALVDNGQFDENLYFAISAMTVKIPPLRNRKEDIPLLTQHFLKTKSPSKNIKFSTKALSFLYNYSWPGNIYELKNEIEKVISLVPKDQNIITEQALSPHIRNSSSGLTVFGSEKQNLKDTLRSVEKKILLDCLKKYDWNKSRVAKQLGTSRTFIILKAKEYGLLKKEGA